MFWGLTMEPNKEYTRVVKTLCHLSQAALDISTGDNDPCQVMVAVNGKNFLVCTLRKNKEDQVPLDLYFKSGDTLTFVANGKCDIHLTGYQFEEDEESSGGEEEDEEEAPTLVSAAKRKLENSNEKNASIKQKKDKKAAQPDSDDSEEETTLDTSKEEEKVNGVDKTKKEAKGEQQKADKKKPEAKKEAQQNEMVEKKTISGGVFIEDLKVGNGPVAKPGKNVQVNYEGRLKSNNKVFANCLKGPGLEFRLGAKEVIAPWDVGISGMRVGGKRRIVCPPAMACGAKGSPPVLPPNSTLVFEVELKNVE